MTRTLLSLSLLISFAFANTDKVDAEIKALDMSLLEITSIMHEQHAIRATATKIIPNELLHNEYCLLEYVKINNQDDWVILIENPFYKEDFFCYISKDYTVNSNVDAGF